MMSLVINFKYIFLLNNAKNQLKFNDIKCMRLIIAYFENSIDLENE